MVTSAQSPDDQARPAENDSAPPNTVTCFVSGAIVPKEQAVLVKLAPGQRVWMLPEFCSEPDPRRRR